MSLKQCENCSVKCGFETELNDLLDKKVTFIDEWKAAYRSMEPREIINFLNNYIEQITNLANKPEPDPLSKGIISNCLFKKLIERYPGNLITSIFREKLIEKMNEKTSPFELLRKKIDKLLEQKQYDEVKNEFSNMFNSYGNYIRDNEYLNENFNKFLYQIIDNYQDKEIETNLLIYIIDSYLDFSKNKTSNMNLALLFVKLGSYFYNKNEIEAAKKCVLKSKQIYKELGHEKDEIKADTILKMFKKKSPTKSKKE